MAPRWRSAPATITVRDLFAAGKRKPLEVGKKIVVFVTMYGGNDGLSTVIPYTDKAYYAGRPELAYDESEVLPLADGLGFNASMTGLKKVYDAGQLAIVRGRWLSERRPQPFQVDVDLADRVAGHAASRPAGWVVGSTRTAPTRCSPSTSARCCRRCSPASIAPGRRCR